MERRLTARGRDRRQQLMDFAAHRFAEGGYHPTSVAEIVQGLGVGKGVFYWYFSSKEELLADILREAQLDLRRAQRAVIAGEPDPVRRIEMGIRSSIGWLDANRHLATLFQFAATETRFAPILQASQELTINDLSQHVKDGIIEGRIQDADPAILTQAILGVVANLARVFLDSEQTRADEVADTAVAFCLQGLLGD